MAQRYWDTYAKPIRDAIVALVKARYEADKPEKLGDVEIMAGLGTGRHSFKACGIYVLTPGMRPWGQENTPTNANESVFEFPVLVRCELLTEVDYLEVLGQLQSLVVDAVEADRLLSATVEASWVASVERPGIVPGDGETPPVVEAMVVVNGILARTSA